ncbi:DegV domain-containing protein [bioreactor metagenome]|uniref:DegV domain-containing protein n=1 Tax=bioreactor metagenome TaxID=1076179 RepID=A0A645G041_9ZZZZ
MEIADKMRAHIKNGDEIMMVTMSSKGSGTFNAAQIAKAQLEDEFGYELPISIVDSMNFSIAYLHPVYDAVEMAKRGNSRREITDFLNADYPKQQLVIIMPDLTYLRRGGRINYTSAIIGGVIGIVPILHTNGGVLEPIGKERGMTRAVDSALRIIEEKCPSRRLRRVQLVQWNREEEAKIIEELIRARFVVEEFLPITNPEASVTAHAGVDFIGIAFAEADTDIGENHA